MVTRISPQEYFSIPQNIDVQPESKLDHTLDAILYYNSPPIQSSPRFDPNFGLAVLGIIGIVGFFGLLAYLASRDKK